MEFLGLLLLGIVGILIHVGFKFFDAVSKRSPGQGLKYVLLTFDWIKNAAYGVVALLVVLGFILARDELSALYPVTKISIMIVGYAADSAFKNLKPEKR